MSQLDKIVRWILGIGLLSILYLVMVNIGQAGLRVQLYHYDGRIHEMLGQPLEEWNSCEAERLIGAEGAVLADYSWNAFHEFRNWGRDYLAEQPACRGADKEPKP